MVKADIKEAYRMVPIHPQDQPLLGIMWEDSVYIDKALPFGLHSAPKIFSAIADAFQWILHQKGIRNIIRYLDDYIIVAKGKDEADYQKSQLVASFSELGVPIEPSKLEGPSQCLSFLGIEVDTVTLQLRLPQEKVLKLREKLQSCIHSRSLTKRDLQNLVGMLQFATKVVWPGRPFLHRSNSRNTGLCNLDPRQMEKLILPALHQSSTSSASRGIPKTVKMLHLTTSGGYQIQ